MSITNFILLSGLWIIYFLIHSLLASNRVKNAFQQRFSEFNYGFRLFYNILAIALLLPIFYVIYFEPSEPVIHWSGLFSTLSNTVAFIAIIGFLYSLKFYRGLDFLGLTQFQNKQTSNEGAFVISPLHRFVRHPWYLFALALIWTRDMNAHFLLSAIFMTTYFFIGSHFEEQKMIKQFGERYEKYMTLVPGIIPSFTKRLSQSQAAALVKEE